MSGVDSPTVGTDLETGDGPVTVTGSAVERFLGMSKVSIGYLLVGLVLAAVWWQSFGAISGFAAGLGLVMLSLAGPKLKSAVQTRNWPRTEAVVVESTVLTPREATEYADNGDTRSGLQHSSGYVPLVGYEFRADGTKYRNASISPFDGPISRRSWAQELVQSYASGKPLRVRYNPEDPTQSYLRSWVKSNSLVFSSLGFVFLVIAAWFAVGTPGGAPAAAIGIGLPTVVIGLSRFLRGFRSRNWPSTSGVITSTGIRSKGGGDDSEVRYIPDLEYEVESDSFVSTRDSFGGQGPGFKDRESARSWLEETYPVDAEVPVYYDPDQLDRSVLVTGNGRSLSIVVFGLAFIGLGVFMFLTSSGPIL